MADSGCTAAIRPFAPINAVEVRCEVEGDHDRHVGVLRNYAYEGSSTELVWLEGDRRSFRGEWPGLCLNRGCPLPSGHHGSHE